MNLSVVVTSCLAWSIVTFGIRTMNHYSAQRPAQKMNNQYRTWLDDSPTIRRPSPYGSRAGDSTTSKHYPLSATSRYHATKSGGNRRLLWSDDYSYDTDAIANPSRSHSRLDYAAAEYPIYGGGTGDYYYYHPVTNSYEDNTMPSYRHEPPPTRYPPTDNALTSNVMSPSNAFKSAEERQLYRFWQFLINGDAERLTSVDDDYDDYEDPSQQQPSSLESYLVVSRPYEYHAMQKLTRKQQPAAEEQTPPPFSPLSPSAGLSQAILRSNVYELWKNGLPLVKRSTADDVRQLDNQKTAYVAAVRRVIGGREERATVMPPRPADKELSPERIPKSIVRSDRQRYLNKNAAIAHSDSYQEDKKWSLVSNDTATPLGIQQQN